MSIFTDGCHQDSFARRYAPEMQVLTDINRLTLPVNEHCLKSLKARIGAMRSQNFQHIAETLLAEKLQGQGTP